MTMSDFKGTTYLYQGGFSSVSRTTHIQTNQTCVLKVLERPSEASLKRETWCIDNLNHPHIVQSGARVIQGLASLAPPTCSSAFVNERGDNVMCFEFANGGDLFDFMDRNVSLEEKLVRRLFKQLLVAVAYLHEQGCCHLDIKTENILLHESDEFAQAGGDLDLKLADFGLSAVAALGDNIEQVSVETGTERSMAPEMHTQNQFDGKQADMWSVGTILFNMLTGYPPCEIASPADKSYKHLHNDNHEAFWRRYQKAAKVSSEAMDLVNGMLRRNPLERLTASAALQHPFFHVLTPAEYTPRYFCRERHSSEGAYTSERELWSTATARPSLLVMTPVKAAAVCEPTAPPPKFSRDQLESLWAEMREFLEIRDRRHKLKLYHKCWLGREGVAYLATTLGSRSVAVAVEDQMIKEGLLRHVVGEYNLQNRELLYRFTADEHNRLWGALPSSPVSRKEDSRAVVRGPTLGGATNGRCS
jgi:serine/threonine protein kinase